jgi:hypothetical protein
VVLIFFEAIGGIYVCIYMVRDQRSGYGTDQEEKEIYMDEGSWCNFALGSAPSDRGRWIVRACSLSGVTSVTFPCKLCLPLIIRRSGPRGIHCVSTTVRIIAG